MSEWCKSLPESCYWISNKRRKGKVVKGENKDRMNVRVDPCNIAWEDGYGLRDGEELARLCLGGCLCHDG